jgi:hypothetical protein
VSIEPCHARCDTRESLLLFSGQLMSGAAAVVEEDRGRAFSQRVSAGLFSVECSIST